MELLEKYVPSDIREKYEFYNYGHAAEIITQAFPKEWNDLMDALRTFVLQITDLTESGGAETNIPSKLTDVLYPRKWRNVKIAGDLHIQFYDRIIDQKRYEDHPSSESIVSNYISGQYVDYLKGRVAIGLEWNKKDLAFDQLISSLRTFYECNVISAGIIITRGAELNEALKTICDSDGKPVIKKYGSSTTWIGKLLPRLDSRASGGCPILAIGITSKCIEGYEKK